MEVTRRAAMHRQPARAIGLQQHLPLVAFVVTTALVVGHSRRLTGQPSIAGDVSAAQTAAVKIYGAGGLGGLEAYQSGFLVSPLGHVATAWSYVLDVDPIVILHDGRRFETQIVGFEPSLELAVLKIDSAELGGNELPFFRMPDVEVAKWGDSVYAISNLFGIATGNEPASVMQGRIAARADLDARRGTFQTPYRGEVFVLDLIANNPGAAGGALVNARGELVGMLGKELRDRLTGVWLNYAIPASILRGPVGDILAGRKTVLPDESKPKLERGQSHDLVTLGLGLVPDVMESTPVFIDYIADGSPAAGAGLRPDDLILLVDGRRAAHQRALRDQLSRMDRRDNVALVIQRGSEILNVVLRP
ncbi:MAG: trypsin-like peptidase domain-containing protein [Planctomycetota bacterium]